VWLLVALILLNQSEVVRAQTAPPMQLKITILEGEGSLNNIRERTAREPIVQVEDENHKPVAGALILFTIHGQGPASATFGNNLLTYQTTTDAAGRATARGLVPNGQAGQFDVNVSATVGSETTSTVIHEQNFDPDATPQTEASHATKASHLGITLQNVAFIGVLAGIASVLTWSAVSSQPGPSSTSVSPGNGGVGPPQTSASAIRHR
jgi:hypothetical protein